MAVIRSRHSHEIQSGRQLSERFTLSVKTSSPQDLDAMPQQYLMPCDCGAKITVTASQAGDQLVCECGKNLDVPSFTELQQLEPATDPIDAPDHKRRSWSRLQALLFTCGLLTAVVASGGIGFATYLRSQIDTTDTIETIADDYLKFLDQRSPTELLEIWGNIRNKGLTEVRGLEIPEYIVNQQNYERLTQVIYLASSAVAIGIGMTLTSLLLRPRDESTVDRSIT
ncbi:MAG: hypothetical protein VX346_26345 [Planctomycetota bacterium]|nr:hypothetical protein [Planctomycetota bacterium]